MIGRFPHPADDSVVSREVQSEEDIVELLGVVENVSGQKCHPAVELVRGDDSSMVIAPTPAGFVIAWTDSLGNSFHSVGDSNADGLVSFDFFGSLSEVPSAFAVSNQVARGAALEYFRSGVPAHDDLTLEPD